MKKLYIKGEELFEKATDYCFIVNQDGLILDVNPSAVEKLNISREELLNKPIVELLSVESRENFKKVFHNSIKEKKASSIEAELLNTSSENVNVSISIFKLNGKGENALYFVSARDISEQRRAQLQLLRFANAIHYTVNPIEITDVEGKIIYVNPAFEKVTGYTKQELLGKNPNILNSGRQPKEFWKNVWETILKGKVWTGEIENKTKNGNIINERLLISPIIDPSGKLIGFLGIHNDLTEQKKLENELARVSAYMAAILDDSTDAIIGLDCDFNIRSWNKGAEKIYGYKAEEIIGKNFSVLVPPDLIKSGELDFLNEEFRKKGFIRNYETERLTKDGRRITIEMTRTLVKDSGGNIIGSSAIVRDVTEIKKLKRQISHAEKLSVVGQLAAGIAHEVGNPLTSISSIVQVIQRTTNDTFAIEKLELVKNQINRIARTIRELVDFSRPSNYEIRQTDVNKVLQDAVNIVRYGKKSRDINFVLELSDKIPKITLVQDQIIQVFINILLNAVDAMDGKPGEIKVKSELYGNNIKIHFIDKGKGIPDEIKSKIFEPFFTTKKVGEGTGLGLWVSYGIVKNFGGDIDFESQVGKGSTFTISLPIT